MRYVAGGDLKRLLRRDGALDPARATAIAAQIADALDAAHRRGLVHRDVKPSNVLLDHEDGREHCYLADFGLTQSASDRGPADGQFMGTIDYVSPEQIRGEQLDGKADQYGLACLLFECLTGTVPYRRRSDVAAIRGLRSWVTGMLRVSAIDFVRLLFGRCLRAPARDFCRSYDSRS